MADLVQWLTACLDEDERIARAAADYDDGAAHDVEGPPGTWQCLDEAQWFGPSYRGGVIAPRIGQVNAPELGAHIVEHDPARVLREVEAKRKLLADVLAEPHFRNEEDNWYSCAALTDEDGDPVCLDESRAPGPCDCGRDVRVARRVRLLALPFEERPGFAEAIASAE